MGNKSINQANQNVICGRTVLSYYNIYKSKQIQKF